MILSTAAGKSGGGADRAIFAAFIALLVWAPVPLGSNRAWAWALLEALAFILLAAWLFMRILKPSDYPPALRGARAPIALLALWALYILLQAFPLPMPALEIISPAAAGLYTRGPGGDSVLYAPISIERGATLAEFLKACLCVSVLILTLALIDTRERLRVLIWALVYVGLAQSVYGLFNTLSGAERVLWLQKEAYRGFVTGTFINRSHFAGHLEMIIPLALGLFMAESGKGRRGGGWKGIVSAALSFPLERRGRLAVCIVIMFSALFLSGSRGGVVSLFAALSVIYILTALFGKGGVKNGFGAHAAAFMALAAAAWMGLGELPDRFRSVEEQMGGRTNVWAASLGIVRDYPVFGTGAGTFRNAFPMYEDGSVWAYYDHAHNDYLEAVTDTGLAGAALPGAAVVLLGMKLARGYAARRDDVTGAMLFGAAAAYLSMMLHAIVDFNFHIPANAVYFIVIIGSGLAASTIREKRRAA